MKHVGHRHFSEAWLLDFEFGAAPGERPVPRCLVAIELLSGRLIRRWLEGSSTPPELPFTLGAKNVLSPITLQRRWGAFLRSGGDSPSSFSIFSQNSGL